MNLLNIVGTAPSARNFCAAQPSPFSREQIYRVGASLTLKPEHQQVHPRIGMTKASAHPLLEAPDLLMEEVHSLGSEPITALNAVGWRVWGSWDSMCPLNSSGEVKPPPMRAECFDPSRHFVDDSANRFLLEWSAWLCCFRLFHCPSASSAATYVLSPSLIAALTCSHLPQSHLSKCCCSEQ